MQSIRENGFRIGRVKREIISLFSEAKRPVSAQDIIESLEKKMIAANKTTVYRELDFLKQHSFIKELHLQPNIPHFESADQDHHHHLVCENCNSIQPVSNSDLEARMSTIKQSVLHTKQFKINRHALEFFGVCRQCQ